MSTDATDDLFAAGAAAVERFFGRLGDGIEDEWRRAFYDSRALASIAERALTDDPPHRAVTSANIIQWALAARRLGPQPNSGSSFGSPAITLYATRRFYIEALFWLDGSMNIHDHGFDGAFKVLQGSSVHSTFDFREKRRLSGRVLLGDVEYRQSELLGPGSVQQIVAGREYIHSLFHLARPSVSVVVRTFQRLQYSYRPPFLAINSFELDDWMIRAADYIRVSLDTSPHEALDVIRVAIRQADDLGVYWVLNAVCSWAAARAERGPDDGDELAERVRTAAIEAVRARLGDAAEAYEISIDEEARRDHARSLRTQVQDPAHRFFLALLLNVPDRAQILALVKSAYPEHDPINQVCTWIRELTTDPLPMLGYTLSPDVLALARSLVQGMSPDECVAALGQAKAKANRPLSASEIDAATAAIATLGDIGILRPLFRR